MQRRINVFVPFACPRCETEMVVTLEELHDGAMVRCASCGTKISLKGEDHSVPAMHGQMDDMSMGLQP